ncbi:adenylate kinase family enzyme [Nocardioides salarius]|uniref:Adenylate kinase family enzyme n=1 Tax=Nocardioides salarius TaxID=374513 RepID=A0ABS2MB93_9ACTN|nr:adenylate kinase family enzyme [Nocardioides salarius]
MACSRILVVGSPGTGKSRIAAELGARLGLPVVHSTGCSTTRRTATPTTGRAGAGTWWRSW